MKRRTYDVSGYWVNIVTVIAEDDVSDDAMMQAAGDYFEDGFDLKDYMRGLDIEVVTETGDAVIQADGLGGYTFPDD